MACHYRGHSSAVLNYPVDFKRCCGVYVASDLGLHCLSLSHKKDAWGQFHQ